LKQDHFAHHNDRLKYLIIIVIIKRAYTLCDSIRVIESMNHPIDLLFIVSRDERCDYWWATNLTF